MQTPEQYNKNFREKYKPPKRWQDINLVCPKCGNLLKVDCKTTLLSYPPKRNVKCLKCKYKNTIFTLI